MTKTVEIYFNDLKPEAQEHPGTSVNDLGYNKG